MLDEEYRGEMANPEDYFHGVFGIFRNDTPPVQIKIQISSRIAPFIKERRWHTSQRIVSKGDGSIILSVDVAITPELIQWVLGFGSDAYVIEPAILQTRIAEEAEKTRNLYPKRAA